MSARLPAALVLAAIVLGAGTAQAANFFPADEFVVSNTADAGPGSLREAIADADAAPGADRIVFAASAVGTIDLRSALPDVTELIDIEGPGADALTVRLVSKGGR